MALERYRTLLAMTRLPTFTVAELAEISQVRPATIQTIVDRVAHYVEKVEKVRTGKAGGQPWRYRVRPSAVEDLKRELTLELDPFQPLQAEASSRARASLLVAFDYLARRIPAVSDREPERRALLVSLADSLVEEAVHGLSEPGNEALAPRLRAAEWLSALAKAEVSGEPSVDELTDLLAGSVWPALLSAGEGEIAGEVVNRVRRSPVFYGRPPWHLFPPAAIREVLIFDGDHEVTRTVEAALQAAGVRYEIVSAYDGSAGRPISLLTLSEAVVEADPGLVTAVSTGADAFSEIVVVTDILRDKVLNAVQVDGLRCVEIRNLAKDALAGAVLSIRTQLASVRASLGDVTSPKKIA